MTTGQRIRNRRKEIGMSADELADKIGVNRSTIFRYENGDIEKLPLSNLQPIAESLDVTVDYLMGWDLENHEFEEYMEQIKTRPELRKLVRLAIGLSKEEVAQAIRIIEAIRSS